MEDMLKHNIMLFPSRDNHMVLVSIVDSDFIISALNKDYNIDNISFADATTRIDSGGKITITIDPSSQVTGKEWGDKCGMDQFLEGHSITTLIMSPIWFCQRVKYYLKGLI